MNLFCTLRYRCAERGEFQRYVSRKRHFVDYSLVSRSDFARWDSFVFGDLRLNLKQLFHAADNDREAGFLKLYSAIGSNPNLRGVGMTISGNVCFSESMLFVRSHDYLYMFHSVCCRTEIVVAAIERDRRACVTYPHQPLPNFIASLRFVLICTRLLQQLTPPPPPPRYDDNRLS